MKDIIVEVQTLCLSGYTKSEIIKLTGITECLFNQIENIYVRV